jgi:hypothetical protein
MANIVEFKSPGDYLSVDDFYKAYSYVLLYVCQEDALITDMTLTFVSERYPRTMIRHMRQVRGWTIDEKQNGIYYICGDIVPMQIIETKKLSADENLWLRSLSDNLDARSIAAALEESNAKETAAKLRAYLHVILTANPKTAKEAMEMKKEKYTLEQAFIDSGYAAHWEERGEERGVERGAYEKALETARNLLQKGYSSDFIAEITGLAPEEVTAL